MGFEKHCLFLDDIVSSLGGLRSDIMVASVKENDNEPYLISFATKYGICTAEIYREDEVSPSARVLTVWANPYKEQINQSFWHGKGRKKPFIGMYTGPSTEHLPPYRLEDHYTKEQLDWVQRAPQIWKRRQLVKWCAMVTMTAAILLGGVFIWRQWHKKR